MNICAKLDTGITTASADEMRQIAAALATILPPDITLALHGDLGVGKTTFVQGLAVGLGVRETVTSPTFSIYNVHRGQANTLVHLDAYRLESALQLEALLLHEFLQSPWVLAVEWPEKVTSWLPEKTWHLTLSITTEGQHHVIRSNNGAR